LPYISDLRLFNCGLKGTFTQRDLKTMPLLRDMRLYDNAALSCDFALSDLTATMLQLHLYNTSSTITGSLADLPAAMTRLYLHNTSSTITGKMADLPATMTELWLSNTSSTIKGDGNAPRGMSQVHLQDLAFDQSTVDDLLWSLYVAAASPRTISGGTINVGGTNAAPSGIFQRASDCPVSYRTDGKEIAYELLNDTCGVGFNKWAAVTITP
jgi:hypothetical protein